MEAYCFKCRAKREITDPEEVVRNRNRMIQGACSECGTRITTLLGKAPKVKPEKSKPADGENLEHEDGEDGNAGKPSNGKKSRVTTTLAEASLIDFIPREFRTTSTLLQSAKIATEREWGWPEMEIGDWLDTYLFHTMKQRGIILGGYQVLPRNEEVRDAG